MPVPPSASAGAPSRKTLSAPARRVVQPLASAWRRFQARSFDLFWEAMVLVFGLSLTGHDITHCLMNVLSPDSLLESFALLAAMLAIDVVTAQVFGNTPGKAFYAIQVVSRRGVRLTLRESLIRNALLALQGLALNLPIINLLAAGYQALRVLRGGPASYDVATGARVQRTPVNASSWQKMGALRRATIMCVSTWLVLASAWILCVPAIEAQLAPLEGLQAASRLPTLSPSSGLDTSAQLQQLEAISQLDLNAQRDLEASASLSRSGSIDWGQVMLLLLVIPLGFVTLMEGASWFLARIC